MLQELTYFMVFGRSLILYLGILTITMFLITASIPLLRKRGHTGIPFFWHPRLAAIAIALGLFHGTLGVLAYF